MTWGRKGTSPPADPVHRGIHASRDRYPPRSTGGQQSPVEPGPRSPLTVTVYMEHRTLEGDRVTLDPSDAFGPPSELAPLALRNVFATDLSDGRARGSAECVLAPGEIAAVSSIAQPALIGSARRHRVTLRTVPTTSKVSSTRNRRPT